jgi:site-specific DNA-cytosine methylase
MFTYFSLFGGAGIGSSRLRDLGGLCLGSIELSPEQQELWALNNPEASYFEPQSVVGAILPGGIDFLQASPPCIHSSGAKKHGTVTTGDKEEEDYLFEATLGHFTRSQPKLFVLENVPPYFNQQRMLRLEEVAKKSGYFFRMCKYRGADFGLPINRDRGFATFSKQELFPCNKWQGDVLRWPDLLLNHLEEEPNGLTVWQQKAFAKDKPQYREIMMPRVGSWAADGRICYTRCDNLPAITASLGNDGHGGKGRRRMWTVYDQESGLVQNVKVSGFAALMGVPDSFFFTGNYRRDICAIGNGIIPWVLNEIVSRSRLV